MVTKTKEAKLDGEEVLIKATKQLKASGKPSKDTLLKLVKVGEPPQLQLNSVISNA